MLPVIHPLKPRDSNEHSKTATPLELFFDLVSVIVIAAAAAGLHHAISEAHTAQGIITFVMAFFAIWWAWMNYTWFASAYDNDDTLFRLLTILIMSGSLTMVAGIGPMFKSFDLKLVAIGYAVMRIVMIALWLRAAKNDSDRRSTLSPMQLVFALIFNLVCLPINIIAHQLIFKSNNQFVVTQH